MSFAPNNTPEYATQDFWANPERALRIALQQRGLDPRRNYYAQRMLDRSGELTPLAFAYGVEPENFLDFANQYAASQMQGNGGQFSNQNIRNRVNSTLAMQDNQSGYNQNIYDWLRSGTPDEQLRNFQGLQALNQRGRNPALASVQMDAYKNQYEDWVTRYMQDMTGSRTGGATNWIDAFLGRQTAQNPVNGTPAAPGITPTPAAPTDPARKTPSQGGNAWVTPPANAPADRVYASGSSSGQAANQAGAYATPATPTNGYGVVGTENIKYQNYLALINQLRQAQANNQAITVGNIRYDPSKDTERWWHGDAANRFARGESSLNRIIRWLTEAPQGRRDHVQGQVNPNDPTATFGNLLNQLWRQIDNRNKVDAAARAHDRYGFYVQS